MSVGRFLLISKNANVDRQTISPFSVKVSFSKDGKTTAGVDFKKKGYRLKNEGVKVGHQIGSTRRRLLFRTKLRFPPQKEVEISDRI